MPRRKTRVALVSPPFLNTPPKGYGGTERVVANLAKGLVSQDLAEVTVFGADGSHVEGAEVFEFGPPTYNLTENFVEAELAAFERSKDALVEGDYDIIHDHTWTCLASQLKPELPDTKIIHTHHGYDITGLGVSSPADGSGKESDHETEETGKNRKSTSENFRVVAISKAMQRAYKDEGWESIVVYNGIDMPLHPPLGRSDLSERDRLVFIGRIDPCKQPHVAIEAAKRKNMRLDLVGGTLVKDQQYLNWIRGMCDGKRVRLLENAPQSTKLEVLKHAKAVIFPSNLNEPFGLVTIEANSVGVPVIGTPDGAIPEIITPGVNGFITERTKDCVDDVVSLIDKVESIKPDDCRRVVETKFSAEVMARNYAQRYREALYPSDDQC